MSSRSRREQEQQRLRQRRVIAGVVASGLLVVVALVVVLSSGGSSDPSDEPSAAGVVSMIEMAFIPDPIEVTADEARLRIVNDGLVPHSFVVPELGKGTPDLDPEAEMTLDLRATTPGTYRVICDIPGHLEAGMATELIVS